LYGSTILYTSIKAHCCLKQRWSVAFFKKFCFQVSSKCFSVLLQLVFLMEKCLCVCCYTMDTEIYALLQNRWNLSMAMKCQFYVLSHKTKAFQFINSEYLNSYLCSCLVQGKLIIITPFMVLRKPRYENDAGQFPCSDQYIVAYPPWYQNWFQKVTKVWNIADVEKIVSWIIWLCWYFITFLQDVCGCPENITELTTY
jgi:hypothetical protein